MRRRSEPRTYERGELITRSGVAYYCSAPTTEKPDGKSAAWRPATIAEACAAVVRQSITEMPKDEVEPFIEALEEIVSVFREIRPRRQPGERTN